MCNRGRVVSAEAPAFCRFLAASLYHLYVFIIIGVSEERAWGRGILQNRPVCPDTGRGSGIFLEEPLAIDGAMGYNDSKIGVSPTGGAENTHA